MHSVHYPTLLNAPQQIRDELYTQRAIHHKNDTVNIILTSMRPDHVSGEKNPLSVQPISVIPAPRFIPAPRLLLRAPLRSIVFCNSRSPLRPAPPDFRPATLRAPLRSPFRQ